MVERRIIVLLQYDYKLTQQEIADAVQATRYRVRLVIDKLAEKNITYSEALSLPDSELWELFYPAKSAKKSENDFDAAKWSAMIKFPGLPKAVSKKRRTRFYVWENKYCPSEINEGKKPLSYSQFCNLLRKHRKEGELVMPWNREPGRELFIDWCGDVMEIRDQEKGTVKHVYVFVCALGDSGFPFVKAYSTMTQIDWAKAHDDAFTYYDGLPKILVPDNTKTAVTDRKLYDPELNHCYLQMGYHYQVAIIPARVNKPRDKGLVEGTVGWIENNLFPKIEDSGPFYDLDSLNQTIQEKVEKLCDQKYQKRTGTRRTVFEELDKKALRPRISIPFAYFETVIAKVGKDYTVKVDDYWYTVPYKYAFKEVSIHVFSDKIEIWHENVCIAKHKRACTGPRKVIDPDHLAPNHRYMYEYYQHDGAYYRAQAKELGEPVYDAVCHILADGPTEEHNYKSCDGLLKLSGKYGVDKLNNACQRALSIQSVTYTTISKMLAADAASNGTTTTTPKTKAPSVKPPNAVPHENIRTDWR